MDRPDIDSSAEKDAGVEETSVIEGAERDAGDGRDAPADGEPGAGDAAGRADGEAGVAAADEEDPLAPTERRPPVDATAPRPAEDPSPRLHDVTGTLGGYLRSRAAAAAAAVRRHRAATALLAVLLAVAIGALALAFAQAGAVPGDDVVSADARARLETPAYDGGTFAHTDILVAREVDVRSARRTPSAGAGDSAQFGASGYASAEVVVSYDGSYVTANQGATLEYARVDGSWRGVGSPEDVQLVWRATAGVDQERVVGNVGMLLSRAARATDGDADLAELYRDADVRVTSEQFDEGAQTDTLVLSCTRTGAFSEYACELTAHFSFRSTSGQWELTDAAVSEGAGELSLAPLEGTWTGTFQSQQTEGTKCLAAREQGLSVTIDSTTPDTVSGTVSGVAHYHAHPSEDARSCEGDLVLEDVPFEARLATGADGSDSGNDGDASGGGLSFSATLPEDVSGTTTLELDFGTGDDPTRVVARVTTSYEHTGSVLFFPVDETLTYTDLFTLARK